MKTHHSAPQHCEHQALQETTLVAERAEATMSPAQNLEMLRKPAMGAAERERAMLEMQRVVGNVAVGRVIDVSARGGWSPLNRRSVKARRSHKHGLEEGGATQIAQGYGGLWQGLQRVEDPAAALAPTFKHSFKTPSLTVPLDKTIGPVAVESIGVSANITYELAGSEAGGLSELAVAESKVGTSYKPGEGLGLQHEIQKAWEDNALKRVLGFTPQLKGSGEVTPKGGELAVEGSLEGETVSTGLKFTLVGMNTERGGFELLTVTQSVTLPIKKSAFKLSNGTVVQCDTSEILELKFRPNYAMVASWLRDRFIQAAASEAAITTGFIANGAFAVTGLIISLADADDLARIPDEVYKYISNYCEGYNAAMRHMPPINNSPGFEQGFAAGEAAFQKALERVPAEALAEEVSKHNYQSEAYDQIALKAKLNALKEWKKTHWFDTYIGMGYGRRMLAMALGLSEDAGRE